jgi:hypothetical protein
MSVLKASATRSKTSTKSPQTPMALKPAQGRTLKVDGTTRRTTPEWQRSEPMPKQLQEELKVIVELVCLENLYLKAKH